MATLKEMGWQIEGSIQCFAGQRHHPKRRNFKLVFNVSSVGNEKKKKHKT